MALNKLSISLFVILMAQQAAGQSGQFFFSGDVPQAQTEVEFDDWLEIVSAQTPSSVIRLVQAFLKRYPDSDFQAPALQYEMKAWQDLDRTLETVKSAEQLLRMRPGNVESMIALARALPEIAKNGTDPLLDRADQYIEQALEKIATQRIPRSLTPERWDQLRNEMEVEICLARAHVAEKRGNKEDAIREVSLVLNSGFPNLEQDAKRELQRLQ